MVGLVPGMKTLRPDYNVVTWDPRGEFASGGMLHLDSEDFEAKDVSAIISWVAEQLVPQFDPDSRRTNPLIGMVGGSYGGGIQLTSAGIDNRIDAIAPGIAWNSLNGALYPNHAFKTSWASLLLLSLVVSGSRLDPEIYSGIATGVAVRLPHPAPTGIPVQQQPAPPWSVTSRCRRCSSRAPSTRCSRCSRRSRTRRRYRRSVPVKMIWYCGGHGACLT